MKRSLCLSSLLVPLGLLAAGCSDTEFTVGDPIAKPRARIWEAVQSVIERREYPGYKEFDADEYT
ncbi:MAG: hypothetical protein HY720_21465, partial [Planctomycetes bacterium]|nr:hypothetical protein [Planctomycetota bacterium]